MVKDNRQKILTLYREGLSLRMIASNLKVAHSTVCYHIQKMNQVSLERKKSPQVDLEPSIQIASPNLKSSYSRTKGLEQKNLFEK